MPIEMMPLAALTVMLWLLGLDRLTAKGSGWMAKFVHNADTSPLLVCGMASDGSGGIYFALTPPE